VTRPKRRLAAYLSAFAILVVLATPVQAAPLVGAEPGIEALYARSSSVRETTNARARPRAPAPCADGAYRLLGAKWHETYDWSFRAATTPTSMSKSSVADLIVKSFDNITGARNDCGRADRVSAEHKYLGTTTRRPSCDRRDGHNVIGFGRLMPGVLAVTCYWMRDGKMVEADIKINSRESWAMTLKSCRRRPMLEATMTHEAGHVFGLDHVGERRHGRLTMSPFLDGECENNESTLGLGDMRGLEALY
jgi:hypothetical protein